MERPSAGNNCAWSLSFFLTFSSVLPFLSVLSPAQLQAPEQQQLLPLQGGLAHSSGSPAHAHSLEAATAPGAYPHMPRPAIACTPSGLRAFLSSAPSAILTSASACASSPGAHTALPAGPPAGQPQHSPLCDMPVLQATNIPCPETLQAKLQAAAHRQQQAPAAQQPRPRPLRTPVITAHRGSLCLPPHGHRPVSQAPPSSAQS